jgi:hypothetical protein
LLGSSGKNSQEHEAGIYPGLKHSGDGMSVTEDLVIMHHVDWIDEFESPPLLTRSAISTFIIWSKWKRRILIRLFRRNLFNVGCHVVFETPQFYYQPDYLRWFNLYLNIL